ncbi:MAG: hypothetical protein ACT4NX_01840 [Deltaproteobacteria bacterium]
MKKYNSPAKTSLLAVFRAPMIIAIVSLTGLLSALLGDHLWDAVSWATLGAPVGVAAWHAALRRGRG